MAEIPQLASITYDQLLALARQRTFELSGGRLNDTSEAGVLTALLRQQSAAIDDQNRLLNTLPELATLTLLRAMGIGISPGQQATVRVTLVLGEVLSAPTTITRFRISRSGISFSVVGTQNNLSVIDIPAGVSSVETIAVADVFGLAGNVSAGVWQIMTPVPYVSSVVSAEAALGGADPDSLAAATPDKLAEKLSAGSLTRTGDFERMLSELLGVGAVTLAIGKLGPDRTTKQLGAVHCFGLNADGSELTQQQKQQLQSDIDSRSPLASVYVSTIELFKMRASVIVVLASNSGGPTVSAAIWVAMRDCLKPTNLPPGTAVYVNECVVLVGNIPGVERVQSVSLGELTGVPQPTNQPLPYPWSAPRLDAITVRCVFGKNETVFNYP